MNNKREDINQALLKGFEEILSLGKSALGGNAFDDTVYKLLFSHLKKYKFDDVTSDHWTKYYPDYKKLTGKRIFDFTSVTPLNAMPEDGLLIDKPNGSQNWPDILPIFNKKGLPIEIKSAQGDGIIWNSGLPEPSHIYIFGCYKKGQVTAFLGEDVLSEEEYKILKEMDLKSKELCKLSNQALKDKESKWDYYPRPMFNSKERYFNDDVKRKEREQRVLDKIKNNQW